MNHSAVSQNAHRPSAIPDLELQMIRDGRLAWDRDPAFTGLLAKKRVAVVGPARTLIGASRGKWIDSHDLVVRFNDAFEYFRDSKPLSADIGSRTDVLYCNQVIIRKNILEGGFARRRFTDFVRKAKLKCVVCTNNSLSYAPNGDPATRCEVKDRDVLKNFAGFLAAEVPETRFRVVTTASTLLIKWLNGNWGRTGFIALVDVLGFMPEHVNVTGMTFYHGGGHLSTNGPELHPLGNRDGTSSISPGGLGHDSVLELDILRRLVASNEALIGVDEALRSLIGPAENKST
ncbi:MAG: glycosyltransferase family 29 protein [Bacteroidota bacterium]